MNLGSRSLSGPGNLLRKEEARLNDHCNCRGYPRLMELAPIQSRRASLWLKTGSSRLWALRAGSPSRQTPRNLTLLAGQSFPIINSHVHGTFRARDMRQHLLNTPTYNILKSIEVFKGNHRLRDYHGARHGRGRCWFPRGYSGAFD